MRGRNWQAYRLWLAVRAGAPMPPDPAAVHNCALIQLVADRTERARTDIPLLLGTLFAGRK